jgi:lipid II:glycine glycyltransferase (peptidoglycan interpeptide bridge formation enzyme)
MKDIVQKQLPNILFLQYESLQDHTFYFERGIQKAFIESHTRCIDLRQNEDEILGQMHEKGRYNIRLAIKRGVIIERVNASEENINTFFELLLETTKRDGFAHNARVYYEHMIQLLEVQNMGGLYFAYNTEKKVIAAGIFVYLGNTALYYYGASTSDPQERKHMPAYLLQWQAMLDGKKQGCTIYDFL